MPPAYVQKNVFKAEVSDTTIAVTITPSITAGNLIVVNVGSFIGTGSLSGVADTQTNSYSIVDEYIQGSGFYLYVATYYAYNVAGGASNEITATFSSAAEYRWISAIEYSGVLSGSDPLDQNNNNTAYATQVAPGSITPTSDGQLIVVNVLDENGTLTGTPDTGWTERYDGASEYGNHVVDIVQETAAAINEGTVLSAIATWGAVVGSFKPEPAGTTSVRGRIR